MKKHINLELSSVLGTGAIGPVLAVLTATFCSAFGSFVSLPDLTYPLVMLFLSGLAAVFPVVKSSYSKKLKMALWPLATVVVFVSAWTSSTGMSMGEEKVRGNEVAVESKVGGSRFPMAPTSVALMVSEHGNNNNGKFAGRFFKRVR